VVVVVIRARWRQPTAALPLAAAVAVVVLVTNVLVDVIRKAAMT
jgi:hypothetical protein